MSFALHTPTRKVCLTACLIVICMQVGQAQAPNTISGRVVDETQQPVSEAVVALYPLRRVAARGNESVDGLIAESKTDADGRFRIQSSLSPSQRALLFVATPAPSNAYTPLTVPFTDLTGASLVTGQKITIDGNGDTNIGDVPVNVRYGLITVGLQDSMGLPLLSQKSGQFSILMRVRDAQGDIVSEGYVPTQKLRKVDASIVVALPEGNWRLEFALGDWDAKWHSVQQTLSVQAASGALAVNVKFPKETKVSATIYTNVKHNDDSDSGVARQKLARLGIAYSKDSFVEHAAQGNIKAVKLFLNAGIDPNAKDKHGATALIAAAGNGYSDVVKLLLDEGANVNETSRSGESALVSAAVSGRVDIVKALLEKGADPNARNSDGLTPLIVAAGNNHIKVVKVLLAACTDVTAQNNEGLTALDFATQSGDQELIDILKKAIARSDGAPQKN